MITGIITSEDPEIHWQPMNAKDGIVLDLGCGFNDQDSRDKRYSSPYYFSKQGAKLIVGIDINDGDNQILKKEVDGIFITDKIDGGNIQRFIDEHSPTHLKCDIEGGETSILGADPKTIKVAAIEVHTPEIRNQFMQWFSKWGFAVYADLQLAGQPHITVLFASRS